MAKEGVKVQPGVLVVVVGLKVRIDCCCTVDGSDKDLKSSCVVVVTVRV